MLDMPDNELVTPSEKALAEFRARIAVDEELEQDVRDALAEDLGSVSPVSFERLNAVLTGKGRSDEAEEPEGH